MPESKSKPKSRKSFVVKGETKKSTGSKLESAKNSSFPVKPVVYSVTVKTVNSPKVKSYDLSLPSLQSPDKFAKKSQTSSENDDHHDLPLQQNIELQSQIRKFN